MKRYLLLGAVAAMSFVAVAACSSDGAENGGGPGPNGGASSSGTVPPGGKLPDGGFNDPPFEVPVCVTAGTSDAGAPGGDSYQDEVGKATATATGVTVAANPLPNTWSVGATAPDINGTTQSITEFNPPVTMTFNPLTGLPTAPLPTIDSQGLGTLLGRSFNPGAISMDLGKAGDPDALPAPEVIPARVVLEP